MMDAPVERLIYGEEARLLPWSCERTGIPAFRRDAFTMGLERHGSLVAVVVFDTFSKFDVNIHIASDGTKRWMSKKLLVATFAYPFIQLGLPRVTGIVPARNHAALSFDEHLGFVREGYHPKAFGDDDAITLGLMRADCRFIPKEYRV